MNLAQVELSEIERVSSELANRGGVFEEALQMLFATRFPGCAPGDLDAAQRRDWLNALRSFQRGELTLEVPMQPELPFRRTSN